MAPGHLHVPRILLKVLGDAVDRQLGESALIWCWQGMVVVLLSPLLLILTATSSIVCFTCIVFTSVMPLLALGLLFGRLRGLSGVPLGAHVEDLGSVRDSLITEKLFRSPNRLALDSSAHCAHILI